MKNLNFGIIGFGYFGKYYSQVLKDIEGIKLKAIADPKLSLNTEEAPDIDFYSNEDDLLKDASIDSVIIVNPPSMHLESIRKAVKAKKNILVEKPAVISIQELEELKDVLSAHSLSFMVGHIYMYNDYINIIKRKLEEGVVGKVRHIYFRHVGPGPIRGDVDCIWEMGVHYVSILNLLGLRNPKGISGSSVSVSENGKGDICSIDWNYDGGPSVSMFLSWFAPEKEKKIIITGDKGFIVFDDVLKKLEFFPLNYPIETGQNSAWLKSVEGKDISEGFTINNPQKNEVEYFRNCIADNIEPKTGIKNLSQITEDLDLISRNTSK